MSLVTEMREVPLKGFCALFDITKATMFRKDSAIERHKRVLTQVYSEDLETEPLFKNMVPLNIISVSMLEIT